MSFRRNGKASHDERRDWEAWNQSHADLIAKCGLPPGILRSRRGWEYLLRYGYWCENFYEEHINKTDFSLKELTPAQREAFEQLRAQTKGTSPCIREPQL